MRFALYACLGILLILCYSTFAKFKEQEIEASKWIEAVETIGRVDGRMCARKPQVPVMTGATWVPMQMDSIFERCERDSVEYILATGFEIQLRPKFAEALLNNKTGSYSPVKKTDYFILYQLNKQ